MYSKPKFEDIKFKYTGGLAFQNGASRLYQGKIGEVIISREIYTPRRGFGKLKWGSSKDIWYIGKDKTEYETIEDLKAELLKRELIQPN